MGDRDDGGQSQSALDLHRLHLEDLPRGHRRRPPGPREVYFFAVALHLTLVESREDGNAPGVLRNEGQRFFRMSCVAMHRDSRAKAFSIGGRMTAPLVDV